jgi:N-acetylgalactosamine 4-sulfate 6-O-sulfotransferase
MCQKPGRSAKISAQNYYPGITLDASADTLQFTYDWKTNAYPLTNTPQVLKSILPEAKFVIIIRDPTERLYSSYKSLFYTKLSDNSRQEVFDTMKRKSRNDFHQKVELATRWFTRCINDTTTFPESLSYLTKDKSRNKCYFWSDGQTTIGKFITHLQIGIYVASLREWLRYFPVSSFKVVRLEDYARNKLKISNEIFQFLGLPRLTELNPHVLYSQENSDKLQYDLEMFDKTRKLLDKFYAPYNKALNKLFIK